jgi:hypothetical protein
MESPRAPSISEDSDQAPLASAIQTPGSPQKDAKMYTYNSGTMATSNVFHGDRARASVFHWVRVPGLMDGFSPMVLSNVTPSDHEGQWHFLWRVWRFLDNDIFFKLTRAKILVTQICMSFLIMCLMKIRINYLERPLECHPIEYHSPGVLLIAGSLHLWFCLKYIATHELIGVLQPITTNVVGQCFVRRSVFSGQTHILYL